METESSVSAIVEEIAREAATEIRSVAIGWISVDAGYIIVLEAITAAIAPLQAELKQAKAEAAKILDEYSSIQGNGLRLAARLATAEAEVIRMAGLVVERDAWLPQEERTELEQRLVTAEAALEAARDQVWLLHCKLYPDSPFTREQLDAAQAKGAQP